MNLRLVSIAVIAVALAACATRPVAESPLLQETPPPTAPVPVGEARHCVSGPGVVVRLTQNGTTTAGQPNSKGGGVLDSVLNDPTASGQAHSASGGAAGAGSAPKPIAGGHDVYVRMDDGQRIILNQRDLGGIVVGSHVVVENCRARVAH